MPYGISGSERILYPSKDFLAQMRKLLGPREISLIEEDILSIDHKVNVARYSGGLLCAMRPEDYGYHKYHKIPLPGVEGKPTMVEYPERCLLYAYNWDQYKLGLIFSLETFSAAAFSLFDIVGHLLVTLYELPLERDVKDPDHPGKLIKKKVDATFIHAIEDLKLKGLLRMPEFLLEYTTDSKSNLWVKQLRKLRNHTTHTRVTDIFKLEGPTEPHPDSIFIRGSVFDKNAKDVDLEGFVNRCFDGLEEFVTKFYAAISKQVEMETNIPLSGMFEEEAFRC